MKKSKKALLINTHLTYPNWSEGLLNDAFHQKAKDFLEAHNFEVLETKVEDGYQADEEVEKHLEADLIILQTPINWFGAPWIYKKYVDEVFNSGLLSKKFLTGDGRTREDASRQYGTGGLLHGKKFMVCATWNAPAASFSDASQQLFKGASTADFLLPITSNYRFCGVAIVPDYNCFDIFKDGDITKDLENYPSHLKSVFEL
ncbi:NADPH quinone reductase MdaB [Flavobacterium noncentrifugens]|uniref:Modulator of drug activity B n=1 Tax=Flavobacterium noncentrifugens TaxID=1128970 RepID=A0A1G8TFX8_9FLAO|nr:NAD(P)H-dependent oxidoreductase [Flavobacterium noncentrifugens]GEP50213.1 NADPH quinone reductase MdaB [Flavobacterium noncentrifugens]SDJ40456.1 modulator of drug activity B [Flavobacterium noncentrifugens]